MPTDNKRVGREYFGTWRANEVTAEAADQFIRKQQDEGFAAATINRSTQLLKQAYALAIARKRLVNAPGIRYLSEKGNTRQGFFTDAQFRAVESNLPSYLKDFARFGYLTGWRRGEIASLQWADVDGDAINLRAENSKNGCARSVALDGELVELIERRQLARQGEYVFHHGGNPIVDIRKAWATACRLAGAKGRLFHDLRRTAVRNMVRAGVSESVAMSISGHKPRSMFDRYNITNQNDQRKALQCTQDYLMTTAEEEAKQIPVRIQ